jgi:hypothetical protein
MQSSKSFPIVCLFFVKFLSAIKIMLNISLKLFTFHQGASARALTWALKEVDPVALHRQSGIHAQERHQI